MESQGKITLNLISFIANDGVVAVVVAAAYVVKSLNLLSTIKLKKNNFNLSTTWMFLVNYPVFVE